MWATASAGGSSTAAAASQHGEGGREAGLITSCALIDSLGYLASMIIDQS